MNYQTSEPQSSKQSRGPSTQNKYSTNQPQRPPQIFDESLERTEVQSAKAEVGGLGTEIIKFMKKAKMDKQTASGKRKPLGKVSNGRKNLEARAELKKIKGKLQEHEMC